jgi:Leucine-rich repeat (LRR) protein
MEKLKMRCLLLAFMLSTMVIGFSAKADVVLNATNFPDANFRAYITTITGVATGDTITQQKLNSITSMYCSSKSIASLKGIEYFTALTTLYCYNNSLTTLDLSHNTALKTLSCSNNQLTELDMTNNAALTKLYCNSNQLTSLDVTHNTKLTTLDCYTNQLPALDVTHNTAADLAVVLWQPASNTRRY